MRLSLYLLLAKERFAAGLPHAAKPKAATAGPERLITSLAVPNGSDMLKVSRTLHNYLFYYKATSVLIGAQGSRGSAGLFWE